MNAAQARLVLAGDRRKAAPLDPVEPLTIGRASSNRLCLASLEGVSDHHAVVRFSRSQGWLVCEWQSSDGTFLEGQRVRQCRRLDDGDEIRLGLVGPVLVFELTGTSPAAAPPSSIAVGEQSVAVIEIRSVGVQSLPQHPHIFSWWLLLCLGGLLLLPFPLLFWPLQVGALAGWLLLGSRKQHQLTVVLRDGRALRHAFANRRTALAHRNGIRKAIGLEPNQP
ncbi:MAG: FHA domain-containing protein [Cyanobacteria bacterium M_surface_10_m2_179]|nr:FHA domain-containing protein [Cyanobacteria bacterium M_surface_10_m2_179]